MDRLKKTAAPLVGALYRFYMDYAIIIGLTA